ncbi:MULTISPECIES: serine O-acetyltransferase EpsC [unclassified Flavobacterium]|uniref:serine O-acetyltransferase EpsC n=1 Tax=unclassified Flavobacterium TaxID=196869 RepID=UPI00129146CC|nr:MULTISPECIES: serine O-acetyltransferase EpsC [unclassified Flavobacterium]MQP53339.1 serine acetyltransferase [Flavobacterium sp. LMO9]MQP62225.1 serine acetyltransferase [Flavobacterium sp. LMO6]
MNQSNFNSELLFQRNLKEKRNFLDKTKAENWLENLFAWLFCTQEECLDYDSFQEKELILRNELQILLKQSKVVSEIDFTNRFFESLVAIHSDLLSDLEAILDFDPAAKSRAEVLLAYPGFFAIFVYRIANNLWVHRVNILPRVLSELAHSKTGIDIHPGANIGKRFFIDHGTGIVIGETAKIGSNVKIYQGVTLGALSVSKKKAKEKRHPTIEDDVIIYANATILGGNTTIGKGAVIGGNVWITESIPAQSLVYHKSEIIVKTKIEYNNIIDFSI